MLGIFFVAQSSGEAFLGRSCCCHGHEQKPHPSLVAFRIKDIVTLRPFISVIKHAKALLTSLCYLYSLLCECNLHCAICNHADQS